MIHIRVISLNMIGIFRSHGQGDGGLCLQAKVLEQWEQMSRMEALAHAKKGEQQEARSFHTQTSMRKYPVKPPPQIHRLQTQNA